MIKSLLILVVLCGLEQKVEAKIRVVKYVYQKDMSEHCRRRVIPSVFLGNNVLEAHSQILHFSQLEVPYSCFISIRTESGGNIILVIQTDGNLRSCPQNKNMESPVKVYSLGETFGGYWGPLPDSILVTSTEPVEQFYTMKTTKVDVLTSNNSELDDENEEELLITDKSTEQEKVQSKGATPMLTRDTQNYIREIVPIVNITGHLIEGDAEKVDVVADDDFDLFYNIQKEPGQKYISSIMPLMQFSVKETGSEGKKGGKNDHLRGGANATAPEPRFDFEYDFGAVTLDSRLMFPMSETKSVMPWRKYRPYVNTRLNFKKNKDSLFSAHTPTIRRVQTTETKNNDTWSYIEGLLKNLTDNSREEVEKESSDNNRLSALLQRVADWQHNYSAYLAPNLTFNDPLFLGKINSRSNTETSTDRTIDHEKEIVKTTIKKLSTMASKALNKEPPLMDQILTTDSSTRLIKVTAGTPSTLQKPNDSFKKMGVGVTNSVTNKIIEVTPTIQTTRITKQIKNVSNTETNNFQTTKPLQHSTTQMQTQKSTEESNIKSSLTTESPMTGSGSIADHASWENVVQVAPKIAGMLSTPKSFDGKTSSKTGFQRLKQQGHRRRRHRRKRSIHAIEIEMARPHNLTTDSEVLTTPEPIYNFVDMQDFAMLVELQDDELLGHLPLRYLRRYAGTAMFDICAKDNDDTQQHVLFLNTSRIILALNNFTLNRMTVIATPARWLTYGGQRCNVNSLECQVAGKRVCVNKLTACDGIPNCGAKDIYDEDRLLCGEDNGLKHNVYLAAFTFLAVLLTMLYTVHYWLKRCVPKVSEAFFIYTDGTENILYLDSIMRSPLDNDNDLSIYHAGHYVGMTRSLKRKEGIFKRIFSFSRKKTTVLADLEMVESDLIDGLRVSDQVFSFTELEINKIKRDSGVEVAVQTGDSLELQSTAYKKKLLAEAQRAQLGRDSLLPDSDNTVQDEEFERRSSVDSELQVINFLRKAKQLSGHWETNRLLVQTEDGDKEKELNSTVYDRSTFTDVSEEKSNLSYASLRPLYEPVLSIEEEPLAIPGPSSLRPGSSKRIRFDDNLPVNQEEADELEVIPPISAEVQGRDFKRFWSTNKSKNTGKEKQKQRKQLPMH